VPGGLAQPAQYRVLLKALGARETTDSDPLGQQSQSLEDILERSALSIEESSARGGESGFTALTLVTLDTLLGLTELLDDVGLIYFGVMVALLVGAKGARQSQLLLFRHVLDLPLVGGVLLLRVSYQHPRGRLPTNRLG
jgi:hypothetical protein